MNKTKLILLFSIVCIFVAMPAAFALDNDTTVIAGDAKLTDYYFDASIENDTGDGSINHPYKTLTSSRIMDDSNIHLANGEYKLDRISYVDNVNIIGSDSERTVISFYGKGFDLSGPFTLTNVTLLSLAIDANDQNLTATNVIFKEFSSSSLSPVMGDGGFVNVTGCTFADNTAANGGAIYMKGGKLSVRNSLFTNNHASKYGGAISCDATFADIHNSRFENDVCSEEAGGAIYLEDAFLIAENIEINDCYAPFGGAIAALDSELNLTNFKSKNNKAKYYGGSVYSIYHTFIIINSTLINNTASMGGALFAESVGSFHIHDNIFINNTADMGSAVFSRLSDFYYDSIYDKQLNNSFENNEVFETSTLNITFVNNDYIMFKLNSTGYSGDLPSYYNLRDLGQVTSVKNQVNGGNCWAFSSLAALESAVLKAANMTLDLSEENMKNLMSYYSTYGWVMDTNNGGYDKMAVGYLTSWMGPVNESDDAYDGKSLLSPLLKSFIHVQNIAVLKRDSYTDNDAIKRAIMEYGAASTSIYWSSSNVKGKSYYYNGNSGANHAVAIVGWDDNYDKSNFKNTPEGNGAWIIKNSHGSGSGDKGFFYVSYYDTKLAQPGRAVTYAFILNNTIKYDKIYQYDVQGRTDYFLNTTDVVWYKNKFTATSDEYLAAVSTYFEKDTDWDLSVYVNNAVKSTKSGKSSPGYYTLNLNHLVPLKKGDVFEIVFKIKVDGDTGVPISEYISLNTETYGENISFISYDGKSWTDFYDLDWTYPDHTYDSQVACIKAFTLSNKANTSVNINVIYNNVGRFSTIVASVYDEWGNIAMDGSAEFIVDGKSYTVQVVDGKARLEYALDADLHNISVSFTSADYLPSKSDIQFTKPSNIEVSFAVADIEFGDDLMAYINIHDQHGNIIIDNVCLKINEMEYNLTVGDEEYYVIPFTLDRGFYEAEVSGDGFESKKVNFTVSKSLASLDLNVLSDYYTASITLFLSDKSNETVTVEFSGKNATVKLENGWATLNYDNLVPGNYTVNVYLSDNYENNFKSSSFKIDYMNTTISISNMTTYYYSGGEFNIRLLDGNSNPISNKYVRVHINSKTTTCRTDKNGNAIYEVYLENGEYDVDVEFIGDGYYLSSHSSAKINVLTSIVVMSDLTKTYGSHFKFKLLDTFGNPLKKYLTSVDIGSSTEFIESDSNGIFSVDITQKPGSYKFVILNPVNDEEMAKTIKVVSRITENKDVSMYYGAGKYYTVKVFDDNGNVAKGVVVTFKINGRSYSRTTDSDGYASFKLTLSPATYTITATYKGFSVSNKIVIKPTLVMSAKTVKVSKTFKYAVKLLDKNGKILKNKKVVVKFRGKTYSAKTSSKGIASYNIKALSKIGKFKLTASYGTAKMSKTITIKK